MSKGNNNVRVVNNFSGEFMRDGMKSEVPEHLKDPRLSDDHLSRLFNAFDELMTFDKKESGVVDNCLKNVKSKVSRFFSNK